MQYVALGATDDIGASCHFLKIGETGLILDAGSDPERDGIAGVPEFDLIHENPEWYVDHAIITHAHHDHLGNLPVLIQHFPHVQVHMTPATRELAEFLLPASARLQRRKVREGADFDPLYSEEELEVYSDLYLTHELEEPFDVSGMQSEAEITAQLYDAGHILGSAGVLVTARLNGAERSLFYTSDTNTQPQTIIPGGSYPEEGVDVLILESTAGADEETANTTREEEEERFLKTMQKVLGRRGTVLIPSFAMGRAQEMLALIGRFKRKGFIDPDVPVYTAGSMRAIADLYDQTRGSTPRLDDDFRVFGVDQKRLPHSYDGKREALRGPSIIVVSSGMMFEPTLSNKVARRLIEREKNAVLLVGYSKEGSPARRLLEASEKGEGTPVVLSPERGGQAVNCTVERFRFTGHSDRNELVELVGRLDPQTVLLVHGEVEAQNWMEQELRHRYRGLDVRRPKLGNPVDV